MKKLSKAEIRQVQERLDLAFDVIEDLLRHPAKVESFPDNAVLIPVPVEAAKRDRGPRLEP